ncbi:MAG: substrate-binding domain-containing protein [Burkholderiales bacterium]|nr:substrate-binding domain-containing protein [Anaerolineae bacterium]
MKRVLRRRYLITVLPIIALMLLQLVTLYGSSAQEVTPEAEAVICSGELPIVGTGPNGETATPLADLALTEEDEATIRAGDFNAAIAMHYLGDDWPQLQVQGITDTLAEYGIEVIAVTDGEQQAEKQIADIESLIELQPDVIFTIPVDNDALANVTQQISDSGIQLVLIDSMPTGLEPGVDYLGLGASDNYAIGASAAEIIVEELGGQGKVAVLRWGYHVFQTEQRRLGALETFAQYPDIEIVFDEDVNSVEESATTCENLLTRNPDINAFWTAWDGMGTACTQAVSGMSRDDVVVTSVDLSRNSGFWIARGSQFRGTAAQHPYDQGVAEAMIALYAFAGKEPPRYVVVPGRTVTRSNVVCAMDAVFHESPDQEFIDLAGPQE